MCLSVYEPCELQLGVFPVLSPSSADKDRPSVTLKERFGAENWWIAATLRIIASDETQEVWRGKKKKKKGALLYNVVSALMFL